MLNSRFAKHPLATECSTWALWMRFESLARRQQSGSLSLSLLMVVMMVNNTNRIEGVSRPLWICSASEGFNLAFKIRLSTFGRGSECVFWSAFALVRLLLYAKKPSCLVGVCAPVARASCWSMKAPYSFSFLRKKVASSSMETRSELSASICFHNKNSSSSLATLAGTRLRVFRISRKSASSGAR